MRRVILVLLVFVGFCLAFAGGFYVHARTAPPELPTIEIVSKCELDERMGRARDYLFEQVKNDARYHLVGWRPVIVFTLATERGCCTDGVVVENEDGTMSTGWCATYVCPLAPDDACMPANLPFSYSPD